MHITVEPRQDYAILHLRGEFDTYYVPLLQEEIDSLLKAGTNRVILNLRLVRFINSTALGAIIRASKRLTAEGGKLVISHPSRFCADIIEKIGLDRVVGVFDTDEAAAQALLKTEPEDKQQEDSAFEEDASGVIFTPVDSERVEHFIRQPQAPANPVHGHTFGSHWSGVGRMAGLADPNVSFTWNGGNTGLSPFEMSQFLAIGTDWKLKFRLPLLQRGYCELVATISEVEERPDGVKVSATFKEVDEQTRAAIRQYTADLAYLKEELRRATGGTS